LSDHKGRLYAFGTILVGISSLLLTISQFASAPYKYGRAENNKELCDIERNLTESCPTSTVSNDANWWYLFLFAQVIAGLGIYLFIYFKFLSLGITPMFTTALTYLDENVALSKSAMNFGIFYLF
jgi:hypothetical protein